MTLLFILCIILFVMLLRMRVHKNKEIDELVREREVIMGQREQLLREAEKLSKRVKQLSPYEPIVNIMQEVEKRRSEYVKAEHEAREKARQDISLGKKELQEAWRVANEGIEEERRKAREKILADQEKQELTFAAATRQSARILETAEEKAKEIAGDALTALRDARKLQDVARAMKNTIRGYGDEYLVPNHSLLDDLAEEFGHKEAGITLKIARERTRQLVTSNKAAACDYAEPRRKETAIHFVLDAFNGKVDSILSKVKHDNFGKLEQEIRDAYSTVNHNGEAFRNARIAETYLEARLQELKWAVSTNELKLLEREEQRQIRQAMREEEKARKEYEKAMREAEKEESMLQKAMEKARKELGEASAEEREKVEQLLRDLELKLEEAEKKNERAISMAQQTKRGHVYVISNIGSFGENIFKIGLTRRLEPFDRVKELGDASVPFPFDVHAMIFSEDAPALEADLHRHFSGMEVNKVNPRKEFFRIGMKDIRGCVEEKDLEAKWTLTAEAHEYRETLAMEKALADKENEIVA